MDAASISGHGLVLLGHLVVGAYATYASTEMMFQGGDFCSQWTEMLPLQWSEPGQRSLELTISCLAH